MSFFRRVKTAANVLLRADYSDYNQQWTDIGFSGSGGGGVSQSARNTRQWLETWETHCRLQAAANRIGTDVAKTSWILLEDDPKTGNPQEVTDHRFNEFLRDPWKTATGGSWSDLVWMMSIGKLIDGNSYLRMRWDGEKTGPPSEVWPIPPHRVLSVPSATQSYFSVAALYEEAADRLPPSEVLWVRRPSLLNPHGKGVGIARSLDDEISQDQWAAKYNNAWFRNGARPDILVSVPEAKRRERRRLEEEWNTKYKGFWNAFRVAFLNAESKVHLLTSSHKDMEFSEGRKMLRDIIFQTFGIPPEVMGVVENSNRATADAALYIYALQCVLPRVSSLCEDLNRLLVPMFIMEGERPVYLGFESPVRETEEFKLNKAIELYKAGVITRDQCLVATGYDPVGGVRGEEYGVPVNTIALGPEDERPKTVAQQKQAEDTKNRRNVVRVCVPNGGVIREFEVERAA